MKIHRQPLDQTIPAIKLIPWTNYQHKLFVVGESGRLTYAKIPPKDPARAAAEKKSDIRYCLSRRLYHMEK